MFAGEKTVAATTKNYSQFKTALGNRSVKFRPDLLRSIHEHGLINPITVNENFEVIDGQHRLEACKQLGIPVDYIVRSLKETDLVEVNRLQKKWDWNDYLDRYVKLGVTPYVIFKSLIEEHDISPIFGGAVLRGTGHRWTREENDIFFNGKFELSKDQIYQFQYLMKRFNEIAETHGGTNKKKFRNGPLFCATIWLLSRKNYNHEHFIVKLSETIPQKIVAGGLAKDLRNMLVDIHNKSLRKDRITHAV